MWTAWSIGLVLATGFGLYGLWSWHAYAAGTSLAVLVALAVVIYFALTGIAGLTWFALAWIYRSERPDDVRVGIAATLRMFAREWWAISISGPRMVLYRWLMRDPPPSRAELPVVLVHGVLCNAGVWFGFRRYLSRRGIRPVYALSYGPPLASIDDFAQQLAAKIDAVRAATCASRVVLVGHSMGGLVIRAYLAAHGGERVARIVTIGTPHAGSVHAFLFPGISLSQLRPDNPWLDGLSGVDANGPPIVSIWSWHDSMVAPQTSARLDGAIDVPLAGVAHNALLGDPEVRARVADEILAAGPRDPPLATSH